jgi:pilus assembly protein CpaF
MADLKKKISNWNFSQFQNGTPDVTVASNQSNLIDKVQVANQSINQQLQDSRSSSKSVSQVSSVNLPPDYYKTKSYLHEKLVSQVDLARAENMALDQLKQDIRQVLNSIIDADALPINHQERDYLLQDLLNEITGLGPLETLLSDKTITEIMVNRYDRVFVERAGKISLTEIKFNDNRHLLKIIDKIVSSVGRRIDESTPMADARLADGSRVNAIIPPLALDGPALSIRRFSVIPLKIKDLIEKGAMTDDVAKFLAAIAQFKTNIIISGGTGSGKTTLLNVMSSYIPSNERVITIEDTAELQLQQEHVVRLETRPPNIEGKGEITMRHLVKNSLRMRPDRVILGEVRGSEAADMLQAMNTGHEGSLTTIHANTAREALTRLENLVSMTSANLPAKAIRQQIASAVHVVIQISRLSDGSRKLMSIHEVTGMEGDIISTQEIFKFERQGVDETNKVIGRHMATGIRPFIADKLKIAGIPLPENLFD